MFIKNYKLLKIWVTKDAITGKKLKKNLVPIWIETGYNDYERYFINQDTFQVHKDSVNKQVLEYDTCLSSEEVVSLRALFKMKKEILSTLEMELEMNFNLKFRKDVWGNMDEFAATANTLYEDIRKL